jgi:hypothetical protein
MRSAHNGTGRIGVKADCLLETSLSARQATAMSRTGRETTQFTRHRARQRLGTVTAERGIDGLQTANEIQHRAAGIGTTRVPAKVGSAAERPRLVDRAASGFVEERTIAGGRIAQCDSPRPSHGFRGEKGFATGEIRRHAGQAKPATSGLERTGSLERARGQLVVDPLHGRQSRAFAVKIRFSHAYRGASPVFRAARITDATIGRRCETRSRHRLHDRGPQT